MGVEKGQDWGHNAPLPSGASIAHSDAELRSLVVDRLAAAAATEPERRAEPLLGLPIGLLGGDLWRTMGGRPGQPRDRLAGPDAFTGAVDVWLVAVDGVDAGPFLAHLVAKRRAWAGEFLVAMNGSLLGDLDLGPRAHPGDGLIDTTIGRLDLRQRVLARSKARSGSHLPHPSLATKRGTAFSYTLAASAVVIADGIEVGRGKQIEITRCAARLQVVV